MCKRHLEEALSRLPAPTESLHRFAERLAAERDMRDTLPIDTPAVRIVNAAAELLAERQRIAKVLAAFYRAELSMSSVQPILALALELNPDLVERAR